MSINKYIVITFIAIFGILFASDAFRIGNGSDSIIAISFIVALLGGFLSLISPCSAAMLPVFFAYSFKEKKELVKMTGVFYLGLATLFVPLGFSASFISTFFINNQLLFFNGAGALFIILGILVFFGTSWQWLPESLRNKARFAKGVGKKSTGSIYLMGVLFSFASGTCSAPIIGGILTLASTSSNSLMAVLLLLTYAFGLVLPLFIMAWFFDRYNFSESKLVQGKSWEVKIAGKSFYIHTTNIITAVLFIGVGILFIVSRGTNTFLRGFDRFGVTDIYFNINNILIKYLESIPNWPFVVVAIGIITWLVIRKKGN